MLLFARAPRGALLGVASLGAITLSPLAAALNPIGLAPIAGLPRAPRADLDELERLKDWVDERARPDAKVCGLGSSYTSATNLSANYGSSTRSEFRTDPSAASPCLTSTRSTDRQEPR